MAACFKKMQSFLNRLSFSSLVVIKTNEEEIKHEKSLNEKILELEMLLEEKNRRQVYANLLCGTTRHDLNNNVLILDYCLNILLRSKNLDDHDREFAEKGVISAEKIKECLNIWKEYSEEGKSWYDVRDIFNFIVGYSSEGIKIKGETQLEGIKVYSSSLASRMFYNLVDNTKRHGVKATTIFISCYFEGENLIFMYRDDGIGIPSEDKERIFKKGFGKNTGLGLFFAREILAITGITISEIGEYGKGVCFKIVVPKTACKKA